MVNSINEIGGVQIDVTDKEVSEIPRLSKSCSQVLTGEQVFSYSRIDT